MEFDFSWIVSLVSVIASAIVSVISVISSAKMQRDMEAKKHEYELTIENLRHTNTHGDDLRQKRYEIVSKMGPYAVLFDAGNYSGRMELYSLALQLAACADLSDPNDYVGNSANNLLRALTENFQNRDKIEWPMIIESCARAVNYQWSAQSSQSTTAQPSNHTLPRQKAQQPPFGRFASAVLAGFSAFRDTLKSKSK